MHKFLKTSLLVATIFALTMLLYAPPQPQEIDRTSFAAVSGDSTILPGTRQDFAIYLLNPEGEKPAPQPAGNLTASLVFPTREPLTIVSETKNVSDGAYTASFNIPNIDLPPKATLEIKHQGTDRPVFRGPIQVGRDVTLMVMPTPEVIYAGSWLKIRVATLCRKSGRGLFRIPVRAKLSIPGGQQTVNRVIHSDIDGLAVFTSHINNNAAGGIYKCEFSQGREKVVLHLKVRSMSEKRQKRASTLQNRNIHPLGTLLDSGMACDEMQKYRFASSLNQIANEEIINEINLEKNKIFLSYTCKGSSWRQIEIWQNGRIHYTSNLQIESGRVSLSFKSPLLTDIPVKLKLWYLDKYSLKIYEHTLYQTGEQQTPINLFFRTADQTFGKNGSALLAARTFASAGFFADNQAGKLPARIISPEYAHTIDPVFTPTTAFNIIRETAARLLKSDIKHKPGRRFFLVNNDLQLSRYKFSNLKIWHNPRKLLGSMIGALMLERASISFLIGEAEIRSLRLQYLSVVEQAAEKEKLEGLLAPLCEFFEYCQSDPELQKAWLDGMLRAAKRMSEHIAIPSILATALKKNLVKTDKIGPFSPVLPAEVALDELMPALKSGGKVLLTNRARQMPINLSGDVSTFSSKSFSGKDERFENLINARALPIVVEIDFTADTGN